MAMRFIVVSVILACSGLHSTMGLRGSEALEANPIRKVVTLLQNWAKRLEAAGKKDKELYDKFMCHCKTAKAELTTSIKENSEKTPAVQSDIDEAEGTKAKLKEELKAHRTNLQAAQKAIAEATSVRDQERKSYEAEATEKQGFIASMDKAIPALKTGMAGTRLLQTENAVAVTVRKAAMADAALTDDDRESVVAFLSAGQSSDTVYAPSGGEIIGILGSMKADYEKDLATITQNENEAVKMHEDVVAAKTKEVKTLKASILKKTERVGELSVNLVNCKHDVKELDAMVAADQKMLKNLEDECAAETPAYDERQKTQSQELQAIHETTQILNNDDALDLFKATLPSSATGSLLQIQRNGEIIDRLKNVQAAAKILQRQKHEDRPELRFLEMALLGQKVDFSKVTKLIDDMIALMAREQADDDSKRKYCKAELHKSELKKQEITQSIKEQEANANQRAETLQALVDDVKTMQSRVADLDKLVTDATSERKAQNQEYSNSLRSNTAAKEILEFAKRRLEKFYMSKTATKDMALTAKVTSVAKDPFRDAISPLSQLPGQTDLMSKKSLFDVLDSRRQITSFIATNERRSGDSHQVTTLLNELIHETTLEMNLAKKDEEHAQKAYEELIADSAIKRATYMKSINVKETAKAENEEMKTKEAGLLEGSQQKLEAAKSYEQELHRDCDWMLQNFDLRRSARADEADNLKKAKATLHGADYSFVQAHAFLGRQHQI